VSEPSPFHGVVLYVFCPCLTLYSYHHTFYNNNIVKDGNTYPKLTFRVFKLNKNCWAEVALLVEVWIVVTGESLVRVVDQLSKVLFICWVYAVTVKPDSVILK
jgi:hypothetical protein